MPFVLHRPYLLFMLLCLCVLRNYGQHKEVKKWFNSSDSTQQLKKRYFVKISDNAIKDSLYEEFYPHGTKKMEGHFQNNRAIGKWVYYFNDGSKKRVVDLKTERDGYWTYFYENGGKRKEGRLINNVKEGKWKYFYENGMPKDSGDYVGGDKDGLWFSYYESGEVKGRAHYTDGNGVYEEYYETGGLKMKGEIENNKSTGLWSYYYTDGSKKAQGQELSGLKNGEWVFYHQSGDTSAYGVYLNGVKNGEWYYFHENGMIMEKGSYHTGMRDKKWELFDTEGGIAGEGNYIDGTGDFKEYYANGSLKKSGWYEKGVQDSIWTYYYSNGTLEGECDFDNGVGDYIGYYEGGQVKKTGQIRDGNFVGLWTFYDEDGDTIGECIHIEKELIMGKYNSTPTLDSNSTAYDQNGNGNSEDSTLIKDDELSRKKSIFGRIFQSNPYTKPEFEYQAKIFSANPFALILGNFPINLEYYSQQRLGYELNATLVRRPFWVRGANMENYNIYLIGWSTSITQRFYNKKKEHGMFFFGQQLRYRNYDYFANIADDPVLISNRLNVSVRAVEFLLVVGDRLLDEANSNGFTVDVFAGYGLGYQFVSKNWDESNPNAGDYNSLFVNDALTKNSFVRAPLIGVNFGYMLGHREYIGQKIPTQSRPGRQPSKKRSKH